MRLSQYVKPILADIFKSCGCLMIAVAIFLEMNSIENINPLLLWQIITIASAYTLFKVAFANTFEIEGKGHLIFFSICSALADVLVVLWLYLISSNTDGSIILVYIVVILIVKGAVFAMMYIDGEKEARQINEKLSEYKKNNNE